MPPRRRIPTTRGQAALAHWCAATEGASTPREVEADAVRFTLEELAARHPGRSTEVRVPPWGAVQCGEGTVHRRGTPPNVIQTDAATWLALATGRLAWVAAVDEGLVDASGTRANLEPYLPLVTDPSVGC